MKDIEIEKKALIDKALYNQLKSLFATDSFSQVNYYFDDEMQTLKTNHIALRVREKQDVIKFTIKDKRSQSSVNHCIEVSDVISKDDLHEVIKHGVINSTVINDYLSDVDFSKLTLRAKFTTNRIVKHFDDYKIFLDHTIFNNHEDYELEVEATSLEKCEEVFAELCSKYNLQESLETKLFRALNN